MDKSARRLEREAALKELYRLEYEPEGRVRLRKEYARKLCDGVREKVSEHDAKIKGRLKAGWPFERLSKMDVLIMRIAIFEMSQGLDPAVAINEALELVRGYSEEKSVAFVNGVLDSVAKTEGK